MQGKTLPVMKGEDWTNHVLHSRWMCECVSRAWEEWVCLKVFAFLDFGSFSKIISLQCSPLLEGSSHSANVMSHKGQTLMFRREAGHGSRVCLTPGNPCGLWGGTDQQGNPIPEWFCSLKAPFPVHEPLISPSSETPGVGVRMNVKNPSRQSTLQTLPNRSPQIWQRWVGYKAISRRGQGRWKNLRAIPNPRSMNSWFPHAWGGPPLPK